MVGLRENRFNFAGLTVWFAKNYLVKGGKRIEKAPKDGEGRFVALDPLTCELNRVYFARRRADGAKIGVEVPDDAFAYSPDPGGREPWNPDTMTHRYRRYADLVGIRSSLNETRHYSATQLLAWGVDLNTVAGRLGHAEGSTTLRFYHQVSCGRRTPTSTPSPKPCSQRPVTAHERPNPGSGLAPRLLRGLPRGAT
jgi:integrase